MDLEPFFESLRATIPWLILREDYKGWMSPEVARQLEEPGHLHTLRVMPGGPWRGMRKSNLPRLVKALRLSQDPRDALGMHRIRLMQVPAEVLKLFIRKPAGEVSRKGSR